MSQSGLGIVTAFVCLSVASPVFAEQKPPAHELTDEEAKAVQAIREKNKRAAEEAKRLVFPAGLGTEEIDLACRKHNILRGLAQATYGAEAVAEKVKALKDKSDEKGEAELRKLCLRAVSVGDAAFDVMNHLYEKKKDAGRDVPGSSPLYGAAYLDNKKIEEACQKVMADVNLTQSGSFERARAAVESAVADLGKAARTKFNIAKGENSHKPGKKGDE